MDHYATLNLPSPADIQQNGVRKLPSPEDIKQAYRIALLTHHPDKNQVAIATLSTGKPSIDAIKLAYTILADPGTRAEYDRELILRSQKQDSTLNGDILPGSKPSFRTGEELIDLDDLSYDEESGIWYRACRCGEKRGYTVTEAQLEEEEKKGGREVVVGCCGCSLWLRVAFGIAEEG